jgi:tripartite ATP-independent transporter DctP family solute receptor
MLKASLAVLMAVFTFSIPGQALAQAARSFKVAHVFAVDHPVHQGLLKANELLKQKSSGRLELAIFPAGTFANYQGALQAVRLGTLDMAPLDTAIEQYPESGALLAPYAFRDYDHWKKFKASAPYQELLGNISEKVGVKQLGMYTFGFRHVTTGKVKATTPADFQKLKLRVVNFAPYPEVATVLSANGMPLPIGDLYLALANGVVDGQENPFTQIQTMKFNEVQKYLILTGHILATSGTVMSRRAWGSLNDQDKAIFEDVFRAQADWIDTEVAANEARLLADLKAKGMEVVEVTKSCAPRPHLAALAWPCSLPCCC